MKLRINTNLMADKPYYCKAKPLNLNRECYDKYINGINVSTFVLCYREEQGALRRRNSMTTEVKRSNWSRFCKRFNTTNQYRQATVTIKNGREEIEIDREAAFMGMAISKKGRFIDGIQLFTAHTDPQRLTQPIITVKEPVKMTIEKGKQKGDDRLIIRSKDGTVAKVGLDGEQDPGRHDELVEKVAYTMYEQRGYSTGGDVDDWLEAERMVRAVENMLII